MPAADLMEEEIFVQLADKDPSDTGASPPATGPYTSSLVLHTCLQEIPVCMYTSLAVYDGTCCKRHQVAV